MNIQVDPTRSNLVSAMLNSKIRPRAVVGYGVKIFHPSPPNYVTKSPGEGVMFTGTYTKHGPQAPVPEKTISANRGLNPANRGKFVLRLDCVPQNTISTIPGIK